MTKQKISITFADNKVRMTNHIDRLIEAINSAGVKSKKDSGLEVTDLKFSSDCSSAIVSIIFQGDEDEGGSIRYKMRWISQYLCRKYPEVYRPLFYGNRLLRYECIQ